MCPANYLKRTLKEVSGLNTIVFPQQSIALPAIYEPVSLVNSQTGEEVDRHEIRREGACTFLIDGAGMGKSTYVKYLVLKEILHGDKIPIYVELNKLSEHEDLIEYIAKNFDELDRKFDRTLIKKIISNENFLVILDGFDELGNERWSDFNKDLERLISRCQKSSFIITTRPESALPSISGSTRCNFLPLTIAQAKSIIKKYDDYGNVGIAARLIDELEAVPRKFLEAPLMVALLYRTFGFNGAISSRVSTFYDELYSALYKGHDLTKSGFARPKKSGLDYEDFRRLLRAFSFLCISKAKHAFKGDAEAIAHIEQSLNFSEVSPNSSTDFLNDLLLAVPLFKKDGIELSFVHKTVAEYFAAEYIAYSPDGSEVLEALAKSDLSRNFIQVYEYLYDLSPQLFYTYIAAPLAQKAKQKIEDTNSDLLPHTLELLEDFYCGLWSKDMIFKDDANVRRRRPYVPKLPDNFIARMTYLNESTDYDHIFIMAFSQSRYEKCETAWKLITEIDNGYPDAGNVHLQDIDWKKIEFPADVWVKGDVALRKYLGDEGFRRLIIGNESFYYASNHRLRKIRILSVEKIESVLMKANEAKRTKKCIKSLFK